MIFVRRDPTLIPEKILRVAERTQAKLEALPPSERADFIRSKSHVWRAFGRHLLRMSYGKCWYSESSDPQSFFDIDHYRPKLEARRSDDLTEPGYEWLAFSWDNFRLSAQRSNRVSKNEETDSLSGKGNWFPLLEHSPKASWTDRCEATELPVLLDPVKKEDVGLVEVRDDGLMRPSVICIGSAPMRVERSIELYGLNLPRLTDARKRIMRDVIDLHEALTKLLVAGAPLGAPADGLPVSNLVASLALKTHQRSAYSKAARAQLIALGAAALCIQPEEVDQV